MAKAPSKAKQAAADAELRRKLNSDLEEAERDARSVLECVNKLRHGQLDQVTVMITAAEKAKGVSKTLKRVNEELTAEAR